MLVLSRKSKESVVIGGVDGLHRLFKVTVLGIRGAKVKLGFEVDADVPVRRLEVWERDQIGEQGKRPKSGPAAAREEMDRWEDDGGGPLDTAPSETVSSEIS